MLIRASRPQAVTDQRWETAVQTPASSSRLLPGAEPGREWTGPRSGHWAGAVRSGPRRPRAAGSSGKQHENQWKNYKSAIISSSVVVFPPGCFQSSLTLLFLPRARASPDGGSLDWQAGHSPAEEDGFQVTSSDLYSQFTVLLSCFLLPWPPLFLYPQEVSVSWRAGHWQGSAPNCDPPTWWCFWPCLPWTARDAGAIKRKLKEGTRKNKREFTSLDWTRLNWSRLN